MSLGAIIAAITAIAGAISAIYGIMRFFRKPTQQKVEDAVNSVREDIDEFKKTGRPKW